MLLIYFTLFQRIPQGDWLCPYCVCKYCKSFADSDKESSTCLLCGKKCEYFSNFYFFYWLIYVCTSIRNSFNEK